MPSLSSLRPALNPFVPRSTTNAEMPLAPRLRFGRRHHHHHVSARAMRDERLGTVQHPVVALARGRGPRGRGVAPGLGLGQRPRAKLVAFRQWRQPPCLLRVVAEHRDVRRPEAVVRRNRQRHRRVHACELLDAEAVVDCAHPGAAILLRELHAHQAQRGQLRARARTESAALRPTPERAGEFRSRRTRERFGAGAAARRSVGSPRGGSGA